MDAQNVGVYIDTSGFVSVGRDTASAPFQIFVDTGSIVNQLDQSMEMGNTAGLFVNAGIVNGQSFVSGLSGDLIQISLRLRNNSGTSQLRVRLKTGLAPGGSEIANQTISVNTIAYDWYNVLLSPHSVTAGEGFFIELSHESGTPAEWDWAENSDPYPPGASFQNGTVTPGMNDDAAFRTFVRIPIKDEVFVMTSDGDVKINNYTLPRYDGINDQLIVTDGMGSLYWKNLQEISAPTMDSIIIPSAAFDPRDNINRYIKSTGSGGADIIEYTSTGSCLLAPVSIPIGSIVTAVTFYYKDNEALKDLTLRLYSEAMQSGSFTLTDFNYVTSGADPGWNEQRVSGSSLIEDDRGYFISACLSLATTWGDVSIKGAKLTYTSGL